MYPTNYFPAILFFLFLPMLSFGQVSVDALPRPDVEALLKQDRESLSNRFAAPITLNVFPAPGKFYRTDEGYEWTQTFNVPDAHGLAFLLDQIDLDEGATLEIANERGRQGPFTQADVSKEARLYTGFVPGSTITVTYRGPLPEAAPFRLQRIDHVYRPELYAPRLRKDFDDANSCQVNANCPTGDGWANEKSGTARIRVIVAEGAGWCSGNLINNTAQDARPLLLSGFHCMDGYTPLYDVWRLDFGYLAPTCSTPATEPTPTATYDGVRFLAGRQESDFLLLEISDADFASSAHYFAGWDRSDGDVTSLATHFHHPQGDIQKIGQSDASGMPVLNTTITWNNDVVTPRSHHFKVDYAVGTFEIGSSGSAFFDADHRIRGQLNGGNPSCPGTTEAFVGRLFMSWDQGTTAETRLSDWLDPQGTGAMTLDGLTAASQKFVSGFVVDADDEPIENAVIQIAWDDGTASAVASDAFGFYSVIRPEGTARFNIRGNYGADLPLDAGVDVGDVIAIRRHILGLQDLDPIQLLAADVNGSGTVRVSDITQIVRVILNVGDWGDRPNWVVLPRNYPLDPLPVDVDTPLGIAVENPDEENIIINFRAVKTGNASGGK